MELNWKKNRLCTTFFMVLLLWPVSLHAQYNGYKDWPSQERTLTGKYLLTDEATSLADLIMEFQLPTGAWPKNIFYPQIKPDEVSAERKKYTDKSLGTLDNSATISEVHFLSKMYEATAQRRFKKASEEGIRFVLEAQYENGGWPLHFPAQTEMEGQISYAGNTMVRILMFLQEIIQKKSPYTYLSDELRGKVQEAFNKGVLCILNSQILQNGKPTVWCSQYEPQGLLPCARGVGEPASLSGLDSASIVLFLMGIKNPDASVKQAIEGAVSWFDSTAIRGKKRENYINKDGKRDFRLIEDSHAAEMWARYYALEDNRIFFTTEEGERKYDFEELSRERRTTVSWFSNEPQKVLRRYEQWKTKTN